MTALRKLAKGQQCQVRIPGCCNFNPETTVLAHVRMAGLTGIGQKAHDIHASWCCSACHDVVDGRTRAAGLTTEGCTPASWKVCFEHRPSLSSWGVSRFSPHRWREGDTNERMDFDSDGSGRQFSRID